MKIMTFEEIKQSISILSPMIGWQKFEVILEQIRKLPDANLRHVLLNKFYYKYYEKNMHQLKYDVLGNQNMKEVLFQMKADLVANMLQKEEGVVRLK